MPTYSYSASRGSPLDKARELLGGTDVSSPESALRPDEDFQDIIGRDSFAHAVAWMAAMFFAEFAQQPVRITASGKTIDWSNWLKAWDALAEPLRAQLATQGQRVPPTPTPQIGRIAAGDDAAGRLR
jgi:hypothetical protein